MSATILDAFEYAISQGYTGTQAEFTELMSLALKYEKTTRKDLGRVTAYGYAKSKGYTGTEEEFAELMASYATVAEEAADSASEAEGYAEDSQEWSVESEAWATGQRNGVDVDSEDETYHNNSKYYAEQAQDSADAAAESAATFTTDTGLTIAGKAADAKATGDRLAGIAAAVGSPLVITDPDDFDNASHTRVYVYAGTTTSLYTNGDWYYWDGDGWESGGVYNSVAVDTDDTLSVSGMAADAGAVGVVVGDVTDLKSAIGNKSAYIVPSTNLLNESKMTLEYVDDSGNVQSDSIYRLSEFIPIELNTNYIINVGMSVTCWDAGKTTMISKSFWNAETTKEFTDTSIAYIRLQTNAGSYLQLNKGSTLLPYESFNADLKNTDLTNQLGDLSNLIVKGENLIDPKTVIIGKWINNSTGEEIVDAATDVITDFIPIEEDFYAILGAFRLWIYDSNKDFVSTGSFSSNGYVLAGYNKKGSYVRFGSSTSYLNNLTLVAGDTIPTAKKYIHPYLNPKYDILHNDVKPIYDFQFGELKGTGVIDDHRTGIRFVNPVFMPKGSTITFKGNESIYFNVALYTYNNGTYTYISDSYWRSLTQETYTLAEDSYVMTSLWNSDDSAFHDLSSAKDYVFSKATTVNEKLNELSNAFTKLDTAKGFPYNKESFVYFAPIGYEYYNGGQASYTTEGFNKNSSYSEIIGEYDSLVSSYTNYITKTDLGVSSDGINHVYSYTLTPIRSTLETGKEMPTVLIVSGQHGFEKASIYGLFYFIKDLCENWDDNAVTDYMRNHVVIKIIPCANPYGINNNSYFNANNINLNKNYDTSGFPYDETGGETPFSEPETQYIRDWVQSNPNAVVLIDFHTNGQYKPTEWRNVNWIDFPAVNDEYRLKYVNVAKAHLENITPHFIREYNLSINELVGRVTNPEWGYGAGYPALDVWSNTQGIVGLTIEASGGFPSDDTYYTGRCYKYDSEIIGNFLGFLMAMLAK